MTDTAEPTTEAIAARLGTMGRTEVLDLARAAARAAAAHRPPPEPSSTLPRFWVFGVFVTLRVEGSLRGCIGLLGREFELGPTLVRAATAATRDDPRFDPMSVDDVERAVIDVSMLTAIEWLDPAGLPVSIRPGRDGLVVEKGTSRGLLLPQVASENHFGAERFLEETCRKAALPRDAWKHGARVGRFQALVVS